eukprot:COSAG02_NODE_618_length_19461_cov_39.117447_8_plen_81_part_00
MDVEILFAIAIVWLMLRQSLVVAPWYNDNPVAAKIMKKNPTRTTTLAIIGMAENRDVMIILIPEKKRSERSGRRALAVRK